MRSKASLPRTLLALLLLGVLCSGWASHYWHHFTDPHCGSATTPEAQPCATCSALHGTSIAAEHVFDPLPDLDPAADVITAPVAPPTPAAVRAAAPRGPPAA